MHAEKVTRHKLTDAEKETLFEGFDRWLASPPPGQPHGARAGGTVRDANASAAPFQ